MAEVLRPSLVLLRGLADLAAEECQGFPEAVRVEIGQVGGCEGVLKNLPDGTGAAPGLAVETS